MRPFVPRGDATVSIDVSAVSQQVKVCDDRGGVDVRIFNSGSATVWIKFGETGLSADLANDLPIGAGVIEVLRAPQMGSALTVAAIAAGSTGLVYFTPGEGV